MAQTPVKDLDLGDGLDLGEDLAIGSSDFDDLDMSPVLVPAAEPTPPSTPRAKEKSKKSRNMALTTATGGSVEWQTPRTVFDALAKLFGKDGVFALDCAATAENALCERFFTKEDNGLAQSWFTGGGVAWVNPPYGGQATRLWVQKGIAEGRAGNRSVLLIPARTDTIALHEAFEGARVYFVKGRITFTLPGADPTIREDPAGFPSAVVVCGPDVVPGLLPLDLGNARTGRVA